MGRFATEWQERQAAECGCRGSDDLCPCQNVDRAAPRPIREPSDAEVDRAARAFYAVRHRWVDNPNSRAFDELPPVSKLMLIDDARMILRAAAGGPIEEEDGSRIKSGMTEEG